MADPHSSSSDERRTDNPGGSRTETCQEPAPENNPPPVLQLRLNQPKIGSRVKWTTDTVDNEFMGKKKSKCCCIYEKPKVFGESSSSEDEEGDDGCTPHCKGHKKKCYRKLPHGKHDDDDDHHHHNHHDGPEDGSGPSTGSQNGI